jgi:hypothetical protein
VQRCLSAQWVFEMGLLAVSSWGDRIKRRGNGLQNRRALGFRLSARPRARVPAGGSRSALLTLLTLLITPGLALVKAGFEKLHDAGPVSAFHSGEPGSP